MSQVFKNIALYGLCLALLLVVLNALEFRFMVLSHAFEIYAALIALIFLGLGVWGTVKLMKPRTETVIVEKTVFRPADDFSVDTAELEKRNISPRELEVLELIAKGLSNAEIAERLFVSTNTVKTHLSKLFEKLDANRRTQAVEIAKQLRLIA
jgi:DNA-binding CsgD family transcriptional regulator